MELLPKPKVEVVITPGGVEVVRLYGASWADDEAALALFRRLAPLLRQVRFFLGLDSEDGRPDGKPS